MRGAIVITLVLLAAMCFGKGVLASQARVEAAQEKREKEKFDKLRKEKLKLAQDGFGMVSAPGSGFGTKDWYDWSLRILQAQLDLSTDNGQRLIAYDAHLARMNQLKKAIQGSEKYHIITAQYFICEAETWVEEAKTKVR